MRTKILLLTAALSAAGVANSMAQGTVFSVNAVGYVNVDVPPKFSMIANPLDTTNNTVSALFPNTLPDGTTIYKFSGGTYAINSLSFGEWADPAMTLNPGEGAFIRNPGTTSFKVTFVGEVLQGVLSNAIPAGFSIRASKVPQAGKLGTGASPLPAGELGFPAGEGDQVYTFNSATQLYRTDAFSFGEWGGDSGAGGPALNVAEAFFVNKLVASNWVRTFSVNP